MQQKKYYTTTIESNDDMAMGLAEFTIGVNDEDYIVPGISSAVDKVALMNDYVCKNLKHGEVLLDVSMTSVTWYEVNYTSDKNTRRRGVHFVCRIGGSDHVGDPVTNDAFYKLWDKAVIEFVEDAMDHLKQKNVKIYFRGEKAKVTVIERRY